MSRNSGISRSVYPTEHIQDTFTTLCRVYTRTHVARKHVSWTSNLYPDTYMLTDTCRPIQVVRSGSRWHNYYSVFMSRSTNWRQFCRRYKIHVELLTATSGYKWIQLLSGNMCPGVNAALKWKQIPGSRSGTRLSQNLIDRGPPLSKISRKFINNFVSNPAERQNNQPKQNITSVKQ